MIMRAALLLTLLWTQTVEAQGRFQRFASRCGAGRSTRGLECGGQSLAFFEFAPVNGAGMGTACACTTPTGAKGEAMTFTRTGNATCSKQGLATTGIANGDLVVCSGNQPRVESSGGVLGLRVEGSRTSSLLRFVELCDTAWGNVGTPALTGQTVTGTACVTTTPQTSPFVGTFENAAVLIDDNDAAAQEGRSQSVTVSAGVAHTMHCYLKAGTLTSAAITLDGTSATITGLSTSTWSIVEVTDVSSSGVSIVAQVLNGSTAAGTGTVIWGGCQVEAGSYRTSIIPTTSAAVTRNAEVATVTLSPDRTDTTICLAATIAPLWSTSGQVPAFGTVVGRASPISLISFPSGAPRMFTSAGSIGVFQAGTQRLVGRDDNVSVTLSVNGTTTSTAAGASADRWTTALDIGSGASGAAIDAIVYAVQADPSPTRCR